MNQVSAAANIKLRKYTKQLTLCPYKIKNLHNLVLFVQDVTICPYNFQYIELK